MNAEIYKQATPEMKELFTLVMDLREKVHYVTGVMKRLEKELPEVDNEQK
jgi:hypothetical protein